MEMVKYDVEDRIGYITIDRPDKRNALSFDLVTELKLAFLRAENDPDVRIVVLRANGQVFCSGADLAQLQSLQQFTYEENLADSQHLGSLFKLIYQLNKVVIAEVQGHALAGGCGLACVCDFVFAVPEARFGYTEVKIGFVPAIVMVFLIRKIGEQKAKQLLLTADLIGGDQAVAMGLANYLVSKEQLAVSVKDFALKLARYNSGESMARTKKMIGAVQSMSLDEAIAHASTMNAEARASEDCKKGVAAFLEKKDITW